MAKLTRFWIEFSVPGEGQGRGCQGVHLVGPWLWTVEGVGVTGSSLEDALEIARAHFGLAQLPPIHRVVEDIDVSSLVLKGQVGNTLTRAVWYPADRQQR